MAFAEVVEFKRRPMPDRLRYLADVLLTGVEGQVPERDTSSVAVAFYLHDLADELEGKS